MEHHSNIVPWHFLRERAGAVLRWVDVRDDGSLDIEALDAAIGPKRPSWSPSPICPMCWAP